MSKILGLSYGISRASVADQYRQGFFTPNATDAARQKRGTMMQSNTTRYAGSHKGLMSFKDGAQLNRDLIDKMASSQGIQDSDAILAIEARGFIFGSAIAFQSGKPMVVARKPNKLPGELINKEYELEYGTNILSIQKDSIKKFQKFNIVDDVLATGGTARCVSEILLQEGKEITGYSMVIEIEALEGRSKLISPVKSQLII